MRVALVVTGGFDRSGRERVIPSLLWLVERLARCHEVVVYVLRYHDAPCRYALAGATVRDLGRPDGAGRQLKALLRAIREEPAFDVLHGYWAHPAGLLAALAGLRLGVPAVVTCDSGEFVALPAIDYGLQRTLRGKLAVRAATRLAAATTVCSHHQARLAAQHGLDPLVLPFGVDTAVFPARAHEPPGPPYRLLNVASLNRVKDHALLLAALTRLLGAGVDVTLDIVGEDTLDGAVQQKARELGVDHRVTFHGFVPSDRLAAMYRAAHLFVLSSHHEAAGVVLLEAAASGVPVVGTRVGYLADWSPAMARTVDQHDAAALAAAMGGLLGNRAARDALASAALAWARRHDANFTADAFERVYSSVMGARRTRRPAPR